MSEPDVEDLEEQYDEEPPDPETSIRTWTRYEIQTFADGSCQINWSTNDDNDDGYPDDRIESEVYTFGTLEKALRFSHGGSHYGWSGCEVSVSIDSVKVWTKNEGFGSAATFTIFTDEGRTKLWEPTG